VHEENIVFAGQERDIEGYVAYPEGNGPHPAIIVLMEIWGVDEHIRDVARRFAQHGFVAMAPDMYSGPFKEAMKPENIMAGMMFWLFAI
jgi:carboxymethylenebutenolidase